MTQTEIQSEIPEVTHGATILSGLPEKYYEDISDGGIEKAREKRSDIMRHLKNPNNIVVVGTGGGEELLAYNMMYPKASIIGVDCVIDTLASVRERILRTQAETRKSVFETLGEVAKEVTEESPKQSKPLIESASYDLPPLGNFRFVGADAANLPIEDNSVDAVSTFAVFHEVYSYSERGFRTWKQALENTFRILKPGGVCYYRDFLPPEYRGQVTLRPKTEVGRRFLHYFKENFRKCDFADEAGRVSDNEARTQLENALAEDEITVHSWLAAELIQHFEYFIKDNITHEKSWKEINESYYIRGEGGEKDDNALRFNELFHAIFDATESDPHHSFNVQEMREVYKPELRRLIEMHFDCSVEQGSDDDFLNDVGKKIELILVKKTPSEIKYSLENPELVQEQIQQRKNVEKFIETRESKFIAA